MNNNLFNVLGLKENLSVTKNLLTHYNLLIFYRILSWHFVSKVRLNYESKYVLLTATCGAHSKWSINIKPSRQCFWFCRMKIQKLVMTPKPCNKRNQRVQIQWTLICIFVCLHFFSSSSFPNHVSLKQVTDREPLPPPCHLKYLYTQHMALEECLTATIQLSLFLHLPLTLQQINQSCGLLILFSPSLACLLFWVAGLNIQSGCVCCIQF